ncbi:MAG: PAS domain S-box protein [Nitrospirae bacterium]|nr:PAS domain S-box protein [Nitrospirota bacterium]
MTKKTKGKSKTAHTSESALKANTERKKTEKIIRESEERYRRITEAITDYIYSVRIENSRPVETTHGEACVAVTGYTKEEFAADPYLWLKMIAQEDRNIAIKQAEDILSGGYPSPIEHRIIRKDGALRWVESSIVPKHDINGNLISYDGIIRDITERKKIEESLLSLSSRQKALLAAIPDIIMEVDNNKVYTWANQAGYEFFGEDVIGKEAAFYFKGEQSTYNMVQPLFNGNENIIYIESWQRRKDGQKRLIAWWCRVLKDKNGNVTGALSSARDITEQKQTEHLLQQSQKLESIAVLAAGIAHDFNNLFEGIFGYIEMAIKATNDSKVADYLAKAMQPFGQAKSLTQQILTFAKGGDPILKTNTLFPFLKKPVEFALSGTNVFCRFDIPDNLQLCDFDENQISQVIGNIVINARQSMPKGGNIVISAENISIKEGDTCCSSRLLKGNYVRISVKDSGTGIPKKNMTRIFEPFFTTKEQGSGLGLATAYSIIKKHKGCIDVESVPGEGSTFHLYLPSSQKGSVAVTAQQPISIHKGSGRILVMDDEDFIRGVISEMLKTMGYSVLCARDGHQALDLLAEVKQSGHSFDAIILDLTVPGGMGGKEAILEIRKLNPSIPVFASSGYSEDPVISLPSDYGFTDSIRKPYRMTDLARILNRYLSKTTEA